MCCIPQNSARVNVMHSQWINIGGYNWAGFGLVFVTDWAGENIIIWQHWLKIFFLRCILVDSNGRLAASLKSPL